MFYILFIVQLVYCFGCGIYLQYVDWKRRYGYDRIQGGMVTYLTSFTRLYQTNFRYKSLVPDQSQKVLDNVDNKVRIEKKKKLTTFQSVAD